MHRNFAIRARPCAYLLLAGPSMMTAIVTPQAAFSWLYGAMQLYGARYGGTVAR
jgi:hypothetical protein